MKDTNSQKQQPNKRYYQYRLLTDIKDYFSNQNKHLSDSQYNKFSLIDENDEDRLRFTKVFEKLQINNFNLQLLQLKIIQSRGIAVMMGMAICDALGASTEFQPYKKQGHGLITNGFQDIIKAAMQKKLSPRHGQIGVWTDDASMGLAMAYSLMLNNYKFDPVHTRYLFHHWLYHGLGNGGRPYSIGLGGNISISMSQFKNNPTLDQTYKGKQDNNGNGSLMRLASIPITFYDNIPQAQYVARKQSLTTHNGLQASECSRLMTEIIIALITRQTEQDWKKILLQVCNSFTSQVKQVQCLAKGVRQTQKMFQINQQRYPNFTRWNQNLNDRNWNWRQKQFDYSPTRMNQYSGYIGSYCMDGLSMALHIIYHTNSFKECAIKNADIGGDCDTVGSIAGQIAGAIYGVNEQMLKLYSEMQDFKEKRYEVFLVGYKLITKSKISVPKAIEQKEAIQNKQNTQIHNQHRQTQHQNGF